MTGNEFLGQLERLLWDIPEQERREAMEYYRNYFEEAGRENESRVIQELGSPGKVAAIIKADLEYNGADYGEYTEAGFRDQRFADQDMPNLRENFQRQQGQQTKEKERNNWTGGHYYNTEPNPPGYNGPYQRAGYGRGRGRQLSRRKGRNWILVLIFLILCVPVLGGLGAGALGLLVGILGGMLGIILGMFFGGLGLMFGGVISIVYSLLYQLSTPAAALANAGIGFLAIAGGMVLLLGFMWISFQAFPKFFRWMINSVQKILHKTSRYVHGNRADREDEGGADE